MFKSRFSVRNTREEKECWQTVIGYDLLWGSNEAWAMPTLVIFRGVVVIFPQASWSFLHRSLSSPPPGSNFLFQGDLNIIPFYPWPGLGLEYKDRYPVEWTVLEGQQHPTHRTLLNAYYLKKLVQQQRCFLLKERGPLGHIHRTEYHLALKYNTIQYNTIFFI